jgi:hypothetical protein
MQLDQISKEYLKYANEKKVEKPVALAIAGRIKLTVKIRS